MRTFAETAPAWRAVIMTVLMAITCTQVSGAIAAYLWMRMRREILRLAALFCADFTLLLLLDPVPEAGTAAGLLKQMPAALLWLYLLLSAFLTVLLLRTLWHAYHHTITAASIKEGFDTLPCGLCIYDETGLPLLVNLKMDRIACMISGGGIQNGLAFQKTVDQLDAGLPGMPRSCFCAEDGIVYAFQTDRLQMGRRTVTQLAALDVTDLYELSQQLAEKNRELDELNCRLREYSVNAGTLQKEEEILAAKMRVHDEFGNALAVTRYRLQQGTGDSSDLYEMWRQCAQLFGSGHDSQPEQHGLQQLSDAAEAAGITLNVQGTYPAADSRCMRLLLHAGRECLTNAVKHADAHALNLAIEESNGSVTASFTNDGTPPKEEIREGGGLSGLRRQIESAGGTMRIVSFPQFLLEVRIPERGEAE